MKETITKAEFIKFMEDQGYLKYVGYTKQKTRKPKYGSWCTCQFCGWHSDSCVCKYNNLIDTIEELFK
mgnify:CR=1 FL=1